MVCPPTSLTTKKKLCQVTPYTLHLTPDTMDTSPPCLVSACHKVSYENTTETLGIQKKTYRKSSSSSSNIIVPSGFSALLYSRVLRAQTGLHLSYVLHSLTSEVAVSVLGFIRCSDRLTALIYSSYCDLVSSCLSSWPYHTLGAH